MDSSNSKSVLVADSYLFCSEIFVAGFAIAANLEASPKMILPSGLSVKRFDVIDSNFFANFDIATSIEASRKIRRVEDVAVPSQ